MANPLPTRLFKLYAPTLIASRDPVDGRLRIEGVASSSVKDRHGDQLTLKALKKMESSAIGLTIFMNHSYDIPKDVFGTVERTRLTKAIDADPKTGGAIWELRFGIGVASSNPEAVRSFELIETDKVRLGLSIGAMIPEGGATFEKGVTAAESRVVIDDVDLVETSLIGIPANPRAWVDYAVKSFTGAYPDKVSLEKHLSLLASIATDEQVPEAESDPDMEPEITAGVDDMLPAEDTVLDDDAVTKREEFEFADDHFETAGTDPEMVKEAWSTAYKNALPDSAFACPKSRKYPHHSKSGAVDRGHLANALARLGDESNDQCGAAHLKSHAAKLGMAEKAVEPDIAADGSGQHPHAHLHEHDHEHGYGNNLTAHNHEHAHTHSHEHESDHEHASDFNDYQHDHSHEGSWDADHAHEGTEAAKDVVPDLIATRVTVWENDDGRTIEVDTGRAKSKSEDVQSAQASGSDTAGGLVGDSGADLALIDGETDEALKLASQTVNDATGIVKAMHGQMVAAKADAVSARKERDAAIEIARKTLAGTSEIIEKIGDLPAGRKTGGAAVVRSDFDALKDIYGDDVRNLMTKKG
jgi:hypothetical protein